jgi:hypothetical protein
VQDRDAAKPLLQGLAKHRHRIRLAWADGGCNGKGAKLGTDPQLGLSRQSGLGPAAALGDADCRTYRLEPTISSYRTIGGRSIPVVQAHVTQLKAFPSRTVSGLPVERLPAQTSLRV